MAPWLQACQQSAIQAVVPAMMAAAAATPLCGAAAPWTTTHQWTPLAANITLLQRPDDDAGNFTARWRILHITDTHISLAEAPELHRTGTRRMHADFRMGLDRHIEPGARRRPVETFQRLLQLVRHVAPDAIVLTGDIVNFPHNATVQFVARAFNSLCGAGNPHVPILYTAGNHDWLVEGLARSRGDQQAQFRRDILRPLYHLGCGGRRGAPRGRSSEDYGVIELGSRAGPSQPQLLILALDNSMHEINSNQATFVWRELARGLPTLLAVHVPFMLPGATPKDNKHVLCGDPRFGFEGDTSWHIEKRERWPHGGASASTLHFVEDVIRRFAAPRGPLLGILGGHEHVHRADVVGKTRTVPPLRMRCDASVPPHCEQSQGHQPGRPLHEGFAQYVTPGGFEGGHRIVEVRDARFF